MMTASIGTPMRPRHAQSARIDPGFGIGVCRPSPL